MLSGDIMVTRVRFRLEDGGANAVRSAAAVGTLAQRVASLEPIEIAGHRVVGELDWGKRLPTPHRAARVGFELLPHYDHPPQAEIHHRRAAEAFASLRDSHARDESARVRLDGRGSRRQPVRIRRVVQMERRVVVGFVVEPPQRAAEVVLEELSIVALRRELRRRKVGELRRLAAEAGYSEEELREAFEESDDPKGVLVARLVTHYAKLGGHDVEEPAPELAVPTLVRVKIVEGRQLKAAAPFNLSRHRDHDAYVEVELLGKDGEIIPFWGASAARNARITGGHGTMAPLRGHVSDFGGAEAGGKPRRQELGEMRVFALQQICKDMGLDAALGAGGKAELVRQILMAEAEAETEAEGRRRTDTNVEVVNSARRDSRHRQRDVEHERSSGYGRKGDRDDHSRGRDDQTYAYVDETDAEVDPESVQAAGYSATTFRRSAAWKSTIVHQSADPVWNETTEFRGQEQQLLPAVGELSVACRIFDQAKGNTVPRHLSALSSALVHDLPARTSSTTMQSERIDRNRGSPSQRSSAGVAESDDAEQHISTPIGVVTLPLQEVVSLPNHTFEGWLPLRTVHGDSARQGKQRDDHARVAGHRSSFSSSRKDDRGRDGGYGGRGRGREQDRSRDRKQTAHTKEQDEDEDDNEIEVRGGEFGLGELKVVVELVVAKILPDSEDDDDEHVEKQRSPQAAIHALQDAIDGSALNWRSVCKIAGKRVQLGKVLRKDSSRLAATTAQTNRTGVLSKMAPGDGQQQLQLPPLLAAVVGGEVRWCKVCKAAFTPPQCPNSHAIFHYTRFVPPDVLLALQTEARLTSLRLKWATMDSTTRLNRAAAMLQAVVRGKMGRRRAFTEDQWRRLGLRIGTHANRDRSRRLHIAGRRAPTRRWQLKWPVRAELLGADSKGLIVTVPVDPAPYGGRSYSGGHVPAVQQQVVQIQTPGQLRPLYTHTQMTERSVMMIDFYKLTDMAKPDEPQISEVYSRDRRTSAPYLQRRARALAAAAAKGGVLPPSVYRSVPPGTPPGTRFHVLVSLLTQTQPESALGRVLRRHKQLEIELRRLHLLRLGTDRRSRIRMVQTLLRKADLTMNKVAATALQAAWRGSRRRAAVRVVCGPIMARDAINIGLVDSTHTMRGRRPGVPPMKLVLQVLAARVQKAKMDLLREDVLAHQSAVQPDDSLASPDAPASLDDGRSIVTVRYWKDSLLSLERETAPDDVVWLVMDVGASRRVFKARRALLLAGLPKFREEVEARGRPQQPLRRRVKLEPGNIPKTIEQLLQYVHGETVHLSQDDIVAFIVAARHYGSRGEAYERTIQSFTELLDADNCCVLMEMAGTAVTSARSMQEKRAAQRLAGLCMRYVLEHLDDVAQSGEVVRLPEENLLVILKSEQLRVVSEGDILKLAIRWVQHDVTSRASALERIRPLIRWPNIPQSLMQEYSNNALRQAQHADAERDRAAAAAAATKKAAEVAEAVENTFSKEKLDATGPGENAGTAAGIAVEEEWDAWRLTQWRVVLDVVVRSSVNEDSDFIGKLRAGAQFTALEQVEIGKGSFRIRFEDCEGISGWVSSRGQDGASMLEKLDQHAAIDTDHELQIRWVCGLSPSILTDERALMLLLKEFGEVRSVDLSSVHRMSVNRSDDEPVFAVRVSFIKPDASVLLRRRGRRGGLAVHGSEPLVMLPNANAQSDEAAGNASTLAGFNRETMQEMAKLRERLVLVEPDFGDPVHMEQEYTEACAERKQMISQQSDTSDSEISGNEDQEFTTDNYTYNMSDSEDEGVHSEPQHVSTAVDERFLPSPTFVGARPGYYFGVGQLGLGYIFDETSSHWVDAEKQFAADDAVASLAEWLQERVALLQALIPEELRQVAAAAEIREFANGEAIVTEGEEGTEMFVLQKGSAAVTKVGVNKGRPLVTYSPGDAFGERALLLTEPRSATVKATEPYPNKTVCLVIGQAVASRLLLKNPQVQEAMRQRATMQATAEKAAHELILAEARTLQANVFVQLMDGALEQRLAGDRGVAFGPAARGRDYIPLQRLKEEQAVLELHHQRQHPLCAGEVWFVVSADWWHRWADHVNFWQHYDEPGPITNEPLLLTPADVNEDEIRTGGDHTRASSERSTHVHGSNRVLRRNPNLKEHEDYVLICKDVWDCLLSWYGGGPPIERVSVANSSILTMLPDCANKTLQLSTTFTPNNFVVEVYRVWLRVCLRSQIPAEADVKRRAEAVSPSTLSEQALSDVVRHHGDTKTDHGNLKHDACHNEISVSADGTSSAERKRSVFKRARVVVGYDPPNAQEQGKLTLAVGDEIEVLDSSDDFWHGRKLPKRRDVASGRADASSDSAMESQRDEIGWLGDSWKLWSEDSLDQGRFPSTCVVLIAAAQLSDDDAREIDGRPCNVGYGEVMEVAKGTLLSEVKQRACALLGIATPVSVSSLPLQSNIETRATAAEQQLDVTMRAYSRTLGFTPALEESLSIADARLYDGAVLCLEVDRPTTVAKPVGVAISDTGIALDAISPPGKDALKRPPEAVPPTRDGLPGSNTVLQAPPPSPAPPASQHPGVAGADGDQSTDVSLHWRDAAQRGFSAVLGPLFDPKTGAAVLPPVAKNTAPKEGSVAKVENLVAEKLRDLEAEKQQAAVEEDFDRALSYKRALAKWQLHHTVWSALGQRGVDSVEKVSDLVDEIEGCATRTKEEQSGGYADAAERVRRGGSHHRRGAVVEGDALRAVGAASVASQSERIRLAKLRIGWPQDALAAAGGIEELLRLAALLHAEDRPLQRAWMKVKQRREAAAVARAKAEALAAAEEERRQAATELEQTDITQTPDVRRALALVQAEEEAAAGPLPDGWEKIRRGRSVQYRHIASGKQQQNRPHAIDALIYAGPTMRPEVEAAELQTKAGQALLSGDGALALQCLQQAARLVPDDLTLQAALARLKMLAPPPELPEGLEDQDSALEKELTHSDDSEEEEWQQWLAEINQEEVGQIGADEVREQQRRRAAHKLQHKARRWLEAALETDLAAEAAASTDHKTGGAPTSSLRSVFGAALRSGALLCEAVNAIQPGTIPKISKLKAPFPMRENIANFIRGARSLGVSESDCFDTSDLFESHNLPQVATCVLALAQVAAEPPYNFMLSLALS